MLQLRDDSLSVFRVASVVYSFSPLDCLFRHGYGMHMVFGERPFGCLLGLYYGHSTCDIVFAKGTLPYHLDTLGHSEFFGVD